MRTIELPDVPVKRYKFNGVAVESMALFQNTDFVLAEDYDALLKENARLKDRVEALLTALVRANQP